MKKHTLTLIETPYINEIKQGQLWVDFADDGSGDIIDIRKRVSVPLNTSTVSSENVLPPMSLLSLNLNPGDILTPMPATPVTDPYAGTKSILKAVLELEKQEGNQEEEGNPDEEVVVPPASFFMNTKLILIGVNDEEGTQKVCGEFPITGSRSNLESKYGYEGSVVLDDDYDYYVWVVVRETWGALELPPIKEYIYRKLKFNTTNIPYAGMEDAEDIMYIKFDIKPNYEVLAQENIADLLSDKVCLGGVWEHKVLKSEGGFIRQEGIDAEGVISTDRTPSIDITFVPQYGLVILP